MTKSALKKSRRFIVPEVVQTSAMDCGPASLKCLLEGYGISVSYGRLREACQTDVDGTSIDMMEEVAKQLGLEAEQIMMPPDHLFIPEAAALPALIVVTLPNGVTHFVVVWRRHGNFVQVMDPGIGRRWQTVNAFLEELYIHATPIPAADWREYAGESEFLGPLCKRLSGLGLSGRRIDKLCKEALADPHWRSIAALDASTRLVESIVRSKGLSRGRQAGHAVESFIKQTLTESLTETPTIPTVYWSVSPAPPAEDGSEQALLRGAVLVRFLGKRAAAAKGAAKEAVEEGPAPLSPELLAALEEAPSRPGRKLLDMLRADGLLAPFFLLSALLIASAGLIAEAVLFRGFLDLGRMLGFADQRIVAVGALLAFLLLLLLLEYPIIKGLFNIGRHLEIRLRVAFLEKIPRLGDRYFRSRLTSDMAERSHSVRLLRLVPAIGGRLIKDCFQLILTAAGIALLDPAGAPLAALTAFISVAVPLLAQPLIIERDLRVRSHNGALSRFYLDALLGLVAVRAHGAERAVRREHESLLVEWARASLGLQRAAVLFQAINSFSGFGLAVWLLFDHLNRSGASGGALLLVYWALNLPALGQEIALIAQMYPSYRNTTLRLLEPLGAPEEALLDTDKETHSESSAAITKEMGAVDEGNLEEIEAASAHAEKTGHYIAALDGTSLQVSISEETADEKDAELSVIAETQTYDLASARRGVSIKLEGLSVRAAGHTILEEINLSIPSGGHLAVIGPSGAGKSSLVGILLGWYRPAMGTVLIDGKPLDGKLLEELRKETAWVDPSVQLWNRSFIDNLFYGTAADASLPVGQVIEAAELRGVLDKLPQGLQTPLGEGGALVSGGEGQRVRLGRAMLRPDVRLAILDEPFRGLDRERRRELMTRARKIWRNATLICVTHDVSETRAFKRVLVIERGRIVEDAHPLELEARADSRYRAMLEAEAAVREGLWSSDEWRRLRLDKGNLIEK